MQQDPYRPNEVRSGMHYLVYIDAMQPQYNLLYLQFGIGARHHERARTRISDKNRHTTTPEIYLHTNAPTDEKEQGKY